MTDFDHEVALSIDGTRFRYWDKIRISRQIDNIDNIEVSAPFDENNASHRATFQPISYKSLDVTVNGDPFFTGTMVPCIPGGGANSTTVSIGGYALPGVLGQCPPPATELPSEYRKKNLFDIATHAAEPFGITVYQRGDAGPVFDKVVREPGQAVLPFLAELAKQRNFVIGSTSSGALIIWRAITSGTPVAHLKQGASPLIKVTPKFSPEKYFSEITGLRPIRTRAKKSVQFTVRNTLLPGVVRPHIFQVDDAKDGDIEAAVRGKVGRMWANMVSYELEVATWKDAKGNLWEPNTIVRVESPRKMIYRPFDFVIRGAVFRKSSKAETAVLGIMLPGSFTGEQPKGLPWAV